MGTHLSKRKFLAISAAALGVGVVPWGVSSKRAAAHVIEWHGVSLGAMASIRIHHPDKRAAERVMRQVVLESRRLESIFTLYRADSALRELNLRGVLLAPPRELSDVMALCDRIWHVTGGVFDPTVQALWRCYAEHYSHADASIRGPELAKLDTALQLVRWPEVAFSRDRIVLRRRGMALTLNGVAQGYITDRVVELLRDGGIDACLVDMGEIRSLGTHDGKPWHVAIRGPAGAKPATVTLDGRDEAVASSGAAGYQFDAGGRSNHLFNPITGRCADPRRTITVVMPKAAEADALSTAFSLMDDLAIAGVLARLNLARAYATTFERTHEIGGSGG
jgi:thiamine biosynthesis lipoprotein